MTRSHGTRRLHSVRMRTTLGAVVVVGAALAIGGLAVIWVLSVSLTNAVDSSARLRAEAVANLAAGGDLPDLLAVPGDDSVLVQLIDAHGKVVAASPNIAGEPALVHVAPTVGQIRLITVTGLPAGDQGMFRLASRPVVTSAGRWTALAAVSLGPARHTLATMTAALVAGLSALLLVVGVTAWLLAGRALAPVEAIRHRVAEISSRALDRRVPDPGGHDEIARLARTMNDMLARLEESQVRQRRFVANASHELRSPLASALTQLEVDLAHPDQANWPVTASQVVTELGRLQRLVSDLLDLARADGGALDRHVEPVDLDDLVRAEAARQQITSGVLIDTSAVTPARVRGNSRELGRAIANVVDNAVRHARSRVTISLAADRKEIELTIDDDGPGIPIDQRDLVFERFARLDASRNRDDGGTGLGLAIVKEIVAAHRGSITVDDGAPGARFHLHFPPEGRVPTEDGFAAEGRRNPATSQVP
jgi:signal transduction histidine kinase